MDGLMQDRPLLISNIAERAEAVFPNVEVVTNTATGVERSNYGEVVKRARKLASALVKRGVKPGDRVATFAWNSIHHLELYLAIPSIGAVMHTINIRLFEEDLRYIVEHADDQYIFLDATLAGMMPKFDGEITEVLMNDGPGERDGALDYEALIAEGDDDFEFPEFDENTAAALCYTSGTTGKPKGVLYSHRSMMLHALVTGLPGALRLTEQTILFPLVPMFHVNAWGLPYAAALAGTKLVLPGPKMDPASTVETINREQVTTSAGVPTLWHGILQIDPPPEFPTLDEIVVGGAAAPESMIRAYDDKFGVKIVHAWGMTETSPLGLVSRLPSGAEDKFSVDEQYAMRAAQGRPMPLVKIRLDEEAGGEVQIAGPWIAADYYNTDEGAEKFTDDGWLRTGDVAELQDDSFYKLVDRTKDLVKSGGEWISSVELENEIMAHDDVLEAAVIAVPDERWDERPCACVVIKEGADVTAEDIRAFLEPRVAKFWLPERIEFIEEVPKTSVGKFDKKVLRKQFA